MSETTETQTKLVAKQVELEKLYSKNQLMSRIKAEFQNFKEFDFSDLFIKLEIPVLFGFDLLAQMALHKRASLPTLVGTLQHHFDNPQVVVDMLYKAAKHDLIDWSPISRVFIVKITISADVQAELDKFQYPLPMVIEPKPLKNNRQSGYLMGGGSVILRNNHHDNDVCLDHLNRANKVRFKINEEVVRMIQNQWKGLDKAKEGESLQEFQSRRRAFEKYDTVSREVIKTLTEESEEFFFTHKYDKRGRVYCQGYHLSYQGNDWNKAVIEFAEKEIVQ